jgi:hypothetical protein
VLALALAALPALPGTTVRAQAIASPLREHLDLDRLVARRDSFVVLMRGEPRGWQVLAVERDSAGWTLVDAVTIDSMMSQASTMRFDATLNEQSLRQQGRMMGRPMRIALDFAANGVQGTALTPTRPDGEVAVSIPNQVGLLDDNAVTSLLPAIRWSDGLRITVPVLASGKGTVSPFLLHATGPENVTVPAGTFDTWRVEVQMDRTRVIAHVTRAAPHRVVRLSTGPAFEMQLVR